MKRFSFILFFLLISLVVYAQENNSSTYFLIRHAEKNRSYDTDKNPDLTRKGRIRAKKWRKLFKHVSVDAVYTTDFKRTINTVLPMAKNKHLALTIYHPFKFDVSQLLENTKGKNIVIVGHSNTIPKIANEIIGMKIFKDIADTNNSNLYIINVDGNEISYALIKID